MNEEDQTLDLIAEFLGADDEDHDQTEGDLLDSDFDGDFDGNFDGDDMFGA